MFLALHLYFYVKTMKFQKIMDERIGWGDLLIFFAVGFCIEPLFQVYFYTIAFILSLGAHLLCSRSNETIPLGAFVTVCYLSFALFNIL
jgi:hypothetical protein